jgi:hypothetical protein
MKARTVFKKHGKVIFYYGVQQDGIHNQELRTNGAFNSPLVYA